MALPSSTYSLDNKAKLVASGQRSGLACAVAEPGTPLLTKAPKPLVAGSLAETGKAAARWMMKAMMTPALGFPVFLVILRENSQGPGRNLEIPMLVPAMLLSALMVCIIALPLHLVLAAFPVNVLKPEYLAFSLVAGAVWMFGPAKSPLEPGR